MYSTVDGTIESAEVTSSLKGDMAMRHDESTHTSSWTEVPPEMVGQIDNFFKAGVYSSVPMIRTVAL